MEGFCVAYYYDEGFSSGDGGVEDVALEHEVVLADDGEDDGGVFAALCFVDGDGVGEGEVVDVVEGIQGGAVFELDVEFFCFFGEDRDFSDVPVVYV